VAWKIFAVASVTVLGVAALYPRGTNDFDEYQADLEARLEAAWKTRHPGPPLPDACEHDEIRAGEMEIDESPGRELVIASERLGIAMFAESGELLAMADPKGCRPEKTNWWFNDHLTGASQFRGVVLREDYGGCRSGTWVTVLDRVGDELEQVARYRERDVDQCRWDGQSGTTVGREVFDVDVLRDGYGFPRLSIHVKERCSGPDCEYPGTVRYECSFGSRKWRGWYEPKCLPLVSDQPRTVPLVDDRD